MTSPGPQRPWHMVEPAEVESVLDTSPRGLARPEVAVRLERHGPNQLEEAPRSSASRACWIPRARACATPFSR